ncbi:hypothetical protein L6164_030167 [Bauhinia variegata]|uniref:Uncharacterized protein n=1 Tax=Bauhinia variegata TaxID=167791 RepID=A0ACB9LAY1_BAUVA|nr:hypothetical protein L6164_030167 [Bauhinia variegata]
MQPSGGTGTGTDHLSDEKSFRIKQDDSFFSRLMSKETSTGNASSRVMYYGEAPVAVPFMWESQPGTPKHPLSESSLPAPLTPPPSYSCNSKSKTKTRNSKTNVLSGILPMFSCSRKSHVSPSSSWSSSTSSSSSWSAAYSSPSFAIRDEERITSSSGTGSPISSNKRKRSGVRGCYPLWGTRKLHFDF